MFENYQEGDHVIHVVPGWRDTEYHFQQVTRVLKTQVAIRVQGREVKFWKDTGRRVGYSNSWRAPSIITVDDESMLQYGLFRARAQRRNKIKYINVFDVESLDDEQLDAVFEMLTSFEYANEVEDEG